MGTIWVEPGHNVVERAIALKLGRRSRALIEQLRGTEKTDELEALEQNVAIVVKNNKLLTS